MFNLFPGVNGGVYINSDHVVWAREVQEEGFKFVRVYLSDGSTVETELKLYELPAYFHT
jgi:hypothetical protein